MAISTPHPFKAEKTQVGVAIEGTQKTEVVPSRFPGFLEGEQQMTDPEIDYMEGRYVGGNRDPYDQEEGQWALEGGNWTIIPYDGWPIAWAFGADTIAADTPQAGLTQHTITRKQDGPPPTATVEAVYFGRGGSQNDFVRAFLGVYPSTATIQQANDGKLQVQAQLTALGLTPDTPRTNSTSLSLPDRDPWKFSKVNSNLDLAFGGVSNPFARVEDFSLECVNNPTAEHYIESSEAPEPYEMLYGNGGYSLDVELAVTDDSIYSELVSSQGTFTATITFEKGSNGDETLAITAKECRMPTAPHSIPADGKITSPVTLSPRETEIVVVDGTETSSYLAAGTNA